MLLRHGYYGIKHAIQAKQNKRGLVSDENLAETEEKLTRIKDYEKLIALGLVGVMAFVVLSPVWIANNLFDKVTASRQKRLASAQNTLAK